jgi:hypothetical protein
MTATNEIRLRLAVPVDVPVLRELIEASVRGLQIGDYTPAQIEGALQTVFGVDSQLIADGTYFVAEAPSGRADSVQTRRCTLGGLLSAVAAGVSAKRSMAATIGPAVKILCSIHNEMPPRFAPSLSTLLGLAKVWGA